MASSIRPRLGGKTGDPTVYQIARPRFSDGSGSSSVLSNISYPLFFLGSVGVAIAIFLIRRHDLAIGSTKPVLVLETSPAADTNNVVNLTQEIKGITAGSFTPQGSAL
jgi:hypothetical protein